MLFRTHHPRTETAALYIAQYQPTLYGLVLFIDHRDAELGQATATDGQRIWYDDAYAALPPTTQAVVMIHMVLHVACCHPIRGSKLAAREGAGFVARYWAAATDVLINLGLEPVLPLPKTGPHSLTWDTLTTLLPTGALRGRIPGQIDAEELYGIIKDAAPPTEVLPDSVCCLTDPMLSAAPAAAANQIMQWQQILDTASHGDTPGNILRNIHDRPVVETPWEHTLRGVVGSSYASEVEDTWTRPSRRYLAGIGTYTPGTTPRRRPYLGVAIDTSGSIIVEIAQRFMAEVRALHIRTKAKLIVVVGDARVTGVTTIEDPRQLDTLTFTGGGGTDFRPLFTEMDQYRPNHLVFLTDLAGTYPETAPRYPVLWAVPIHCQRFSTRPPFGRILWLK